MSSLFNRFKKNNSNAENKFEQQRNANRKTLQPQDLTSTQSEISAHDKSGSLSIPSSNTASSGSLAYYEEGASVNAMTQLSNKNSKKGDNNKEKMPPPEEIVAQFEKLLKYQGITPTEKRYKLMIMKPLEEKWKLVKIMQNTKKEADKLHTIKDTPEYIVHRLKDEPTLGSVTELISLLKGAKSEDWIRKFLDLQGLECLFQILVESCDQQIREQYVFVNIFNNLLNVTLFN